MLSLLFHINLSAQHGTHHSVIWSGHIMCHSMYTFGPIQPYTHVAFCLTIHACIRSSSRGPKIREFARGSTSFAADTGLHSLPASSHYREDNGACWCGKAKCLVYRAPVIMMMMMRCLCCMLAWQGWLLCLVIVRRTGLQIHVHFVCGCGNAKRFGYKHPLQWG